MKISCSHCAYAYEVLPERCAFCGRPLQGGRRLPFTGRVSLTEELLEQAKEVTLTQRAQLIALEAPQQGEGVSTFLHHFGLHVTRLSVGFKVMNTHPFSLNAEPSPLSIPLIYQHLLNSLFELNLTDPLAERVRWAQRQLSALNPPSHVERALKRLMTHTPKGVTSSPPKLNSLLRPPKHLHPKRLHSKRPTQVMSFQDLESSHQVFDQAFDRAPEKQKEQEVQDNLISSSTPYHQPLSLAVDEEEYEESLMGSLTHQLLKGTPPAPTDLIQHSLNATLHPSREDEPTEPPHAQPEAPSAHSAADDLTHILGFYARRQPLTLCLLDLQSAPTPDLEALYELLSRLKKLHLPLLILLERPPGELKSLCGLAREVTSLTFEELSALVREVFPHLEEPLAFVEALFNRSKGHPLTLIHELLKVTMRGAEGLAHPLLPVHVKPAHKRYELQDMLTFCVATGPTTSASQLTLIERCLSKAPWSVKGLSEHDWGVMLQAAVERGDLKQTQHRRLLHEPSYRFARSSHKEPYERLWSTRYTARVRQIVHCRLAEWMSAQEYVPEAHVQVGLAIAEQWLLGAQPLEAARVSLEVAQLLIKKGNHNLAYSALNQAYGVLEEREVPWVLLKPLALARAQVATHRGLPHEAEPTLLHALKRASQLSDLNASYELGQQLSQLYLTRGFHQKAREVSEWLSSLPREALYEHVPGPGAIFDERTRAHTARAHASLPPLQPSHGPQAQTSLTPCPPQRHATLEGTPKRTTITMNDVRDLTPPPSPVLHVLSTLKAKGYEAWVVGGSVRDRLLGRPVNDWDITTSATPQEVSACFERVIETGIEHGTVTVLSEGIHVEVTTYRVDGLYLDGRRPSEVSFTRSLREDLARRDFTINAIAWDPTTKTLEDPFEGLADLGRELIKAVGHPLDRFREDGLRVLRAVRFAAVLGFTIEPETWAGLCGALDVFQRVAMERVQVELFKTLLSDQPEWALSALKQSQLLALICPQLDALAEPSFERLTRALTRSPAHLDVRLSLLYMPLEDPESIAHQHLTHLKCARKLTQGVTQLLRWRQVDPASERTDGQVRALSAQVGLERLPMWIAYRRAWAEAEHDEAELRAWTALEERFKALNIEECPQSPRDLALRGHELASLLNLPPSPLIGALLNALLQHVWEHPEDNTSARLLAIAPSLARSLGVESPL